MWWVCHDQAWRKMYEGIRERYLLCQDLQVLLSNKGRRVLVELSIVRKTGSVYENSGIRTRAP
jgi:hypothetical protein